MQNLHEQHLRFNNTGINLHFIYGYSNSAWTGTFDECEYNISVAHLTGTEQWRVFHHVQRVDHGSLLQQQLHCAHVTRQRGCMESWVNGNAKIQKTKSVKTGMQSHNYVAVNLCQWIVKGLRRADTLKHSQGWGSPHLLPPVPWTIWTWVKCMEVIWTPVSCTGLSSVSLTRLNHGMLRMHKQWLLGWAEGLSRGPLYVQNNPLGGSKCLHVCACLSGNSAGSGGSLFTEHTLMLLTGSLASLSQSLLPLPGNLLWHHPNNEQPSG